MSGISSYVPHKGDVVLINFNPSAGHEISKYRPAMVVSNERYAQLTGLALVCPITHAENNRLLDSGLLIEIDAEKVNGYINPLQFHTFDYKRRDMKFVERASRKNLAQVIQTINDIVNARD